MFRTQSENCVNNIYEFIGLSRRFISRLEQKNNHTKVFQGHLLDKSGLAIASIKPISPSSLVQGIFTEITITRK